MAVFGSGSATQFYKRPFQGNIGNDGLTLSLWVKGASTATTNIYLSLQTSNASANFAIYNFSTNSVTLMQQQDGSGTQAWSAFDSSAINSGGWTHLLMSVPQSGTVVPYANTITGGGIWTHSTNTTPVSTSNWTEIDVGGQTGANPMATTTLIGEVAIWRTGLSQGQVNTLFAGENPLRVAPGKLMDYWPLRNSLANYGLSRVGLAPQGGAVPVYGEHPPVVPMPRRRWLYHVVAGGAPSRRPFITIAA